MGREEEIERESTEKRKRWRDRKRGGSGMERCIDFRRASISSVGGFPRRRQRITTLRDSTDEDRQMQLQETVGLRDRERLQKKDKDRVFPKKRRVDKSEMQPRSGAGAGGEGYGDMESTDSSDEEYHEEADVTKNHHNKGMNQLSPMSSSLSNNRLGLRRLRSSPVIRFPADELFGVPVPRRVRSVSAKRLRKCWISGMDGFGEDFSYRRFSPATMNLIRSGGGSPFSLGSSMKKRMKSTEPRTRILSSPSSMVQDDIEIEVAEALFDLMKQSQSQSLSPSSQTQEKVDIDSMETADSELKRLKAEGRENENNTFSDQNEQLKEASAATIAIDSTKENEVVEKEKFLDEAAGELVGGDGFVNKGTVGSLKESESPSCVKVDACNVQDPTVTKAEHGSAVAVAKQETNLEIDLMASPPVERGALENREIHSKLMNGAVDKKSETISEDGAMGVAITSQKENENASRLPDHDVEKCWNGFLSVGNCTIQQPQGQKGQKNRPTSSFPFHIGISSWPGVLPDPQKTAWPINGNPRPSMTMRFPQFKFSQPRPKRCAIHRYIAHSIGAHLQLINKSLSSGPTDPVTSCGLKSNPMLLPTMKFAPGNLSLGDLQSMGSGNDKPPPGQANNLLHCPGFMFPLGHNLPSMMAPVNSSTTTAVGGSSPLTGKPALAGTGGANAVSYNNQIFPCNGITPYMTILNNGCPIPTSTSSAMPTFRGGSPAVPFFNSSFFNQQQQQVLLPHAPPPAHSLAHNTISGSSSHKQVPSLTQPNWGASGKTQNACYQGGSVGNRQGDQLGSKGRVELSSMSQTRSIYHTGSPASWNKYMNGNQVFQATSSTTKR